MQLAQNWMFYRNLITQNESILFNSTFFRGKWKKKFSWKRGIACLALSCSTCICYTENIIYSILRLKYINWLEKAWKYPSVYKFALTINIHLSRTSFPALTQVASYNISVYIVWILYHFFYCFIVKGPVIFSCLINEMLI